MEEATSQNNRPNDYLSRLVPDAEDGTEFHDLWDTSEQLFLASSVLRTDRNWMSVSRAIKPFGELTRPTDWYTPKNCAFQYNKLLSEIEDDSKKKTVPRTERETSEVRLVKNITEKRLNELSWLSKQTQSSANTVRNYVEMIQNNEFDDDELDELINKMEEFDKTEIEYYNQYLGKRNKLIEAKKLNTGKIKGKAKTKVIETKKKMPNFPDLSDSSSRQSPMKEIRIKKEPIEDAKPIKTESLTPLTLNALLDTKVTTASESPLLTSLLRSISSPQTPLSTVCSPSKESDTMDEFKSEASPRSSVPPSPRSATASSPMLNSLLKNSPSSTTPLQMSPAKETSPKVPSQPSFFIPSSLTSPQQVTVTTSALSPSHQFFHQQDLDGKKVTIRTSPVTSACLSAPTLSKLLEMPPSSPGKLPPLPVLDLPVPMSSISTPTTPDHAAKHSLDTKQIVFQSPAKTSSIKAEQNFVPDSTVLLKSSASYSRKGSTSEDIKPIIVADRGEAPERSTNVILEDLSDVFDQAFVKVEVKKEIGDEEDSTTKAILETIDATNSVDILSPSSIKLEPVNPSHVEEVSLADFILNDSLDLEGAFQGKASSASDIVPTIQTISSVQELLSAKNLDSIEEDKGVTSKKFYKSRVSKKEESTEKPVSDVGVLYLPKSTLTPKSENENSSLMVTADELIATFDIATADIKTEKPQECKPSKSESKSPVSKKPRLFDRLSTEKKELSEEEAPPTVGRPRGRKGKKGRGRGFKGTPVKPKPEEVFEFSESSMEENSTGYKSKNKTCYTPRLREDTLSEEVKIKQEPEDSPTENKLSSQTRNKQGKSPQATTSARKNLFTSDEERMGDVTMSDDASNQLLTEDQIKKENEVTSESKDDISKRSTKVELPKKKIAGKRSAVGKKRKLSSLDMEDLSAGSRDSEDMSTVQGKETSEEKFVVPPISMDMEVETNDSHPSSIAAESYKHMEENDESLQGSATTDLSPPATAEIKEEKEIPTFGKQNWFQGASPKSSEAVSQSSDPESEEDESDNDNQSVSTTKSTSQYTGTHPRQKRKERETPEYKAWKKAINIVFREASCHKNANVFLQKVTNDVAPGYLNIVHRPMDLAQIKKNIEYGVIRTTEEFHRDILIMFQNAIMYNSSDHDVHQMAVQMQQDVLVQINAFVRTQSNSKDEVSEPVSSLRGTRKSLKGKQSIGKGKEDTEKE
ncbi:hypothetical protein JTE90_001394 [Oedothorax gibbosus]|uniref:Bromo domain-containing protein n=1 Tax=Oedothorax gibbosus TaxID=931172 RepID=A0AAV6VHE5_9ARAC|nr:hypothetical protein JTE90_001394 [Oedothorax gibbosus]